MHTAPFGLLNLNKPAGWTSRQAVDRVARIVKPAKAGHAGTLDPLATGVLVICVGPATRLIPFVQELPKTYRAAFLLGKRSDTDDVTGDVQDVPFDRTPGVDDIRSALAGFVGEIEQVPPQFSAVHVDGRRAYKLARKGETVALSPRPVVVHRIDVIRFAFPALELEIHCGSGTYVRSIGRDLGEALGCGAVMSELERTAIGPFTIANAIDPQTLTADDIETQLQPALTAVAHLPRYDCTPEDVAELRHGRIVRVGAELARHADDELIAVVDPNGRLTALGVWRDNGRAIAPRQVFC